MMDTPNCPVDFIAINENKVRIVALFALVLTVIYIITGWWPIIAFLVLDFGLRSFKLNQYSLLAMLAGWMVKLFNIGMKPTDQAPKRFAAWVGFGFTTAMLLFYFLEIDIVVTGLAVILCVFAFLESVLGFCAGCYVYSFYNKVFGKADNSSQNNFY